MVYDLQGDEDLEKNKMKKKKNQSALQRLKEKIRAKKQVGWVFIYDLDIMTMHNIFI